MPSSSSTSSSSSSPRSTKSSSSFSRHYPSLPSSSTFDRPSPHHLFATPDKSPHRNHPSIPSLLHTIQSFQRTCTIDTPDATFHVAPPAIHALHRELQHPRILSGHTADTLRFTYDSLSSTLTLRCMISPVHESIGHLATHIKQEMIFDAFLSRHEARHLLINTNASVALPGGLIKQPDAAFQFLDPAARLEPFPRILFEAAFAQSYESVLEYARLWLVRSEGAVKLVVVVKLFEGPVQHPDDEDDDGHAPSSPASTSFSSASAYSDFLNTADPAAWVGPITGFMELHRYDPLSCGIAQDGPRYELYPVGQQADPRIGIADLLPLSHVVGDPARSYPLPLAELRRLIEGGVRRLALLRRAEGRGRASAEDGGVYGDV